MNKFRLDQQIRIEESFRDEIDQGAKSQEFCHYLATHPAAYLEYREDQMYFHRMRRNSVDF